MLNALDEQFLESLRAAFAIEGDEHTSAISECLLELEKVGPEDHDDVFERLYREVHSLKGASRAVNNAGIEAICQAFENLLDNWKKLEANLTPENFDILHRAGADMRRNLGGVSNGVVDSTTLQIVQALKSIRENPKPAAAPVVLAPPVTVEIVPEPVEPEPVLELPPVELAKEPPVEETVEEEVSAPSRQDQFDPDYDDYPEATSKPYIEEKAAPRGPSETVRLATSQLDQLLSQAEELLVVKQAAQVRTQELNLLKGIFAEWHKEWNKVRGTIKPLPSPPKNRAGDRSRGTDLQDFLQWNQSQVQALEERVGGLARDAEHEGRVFAGLIDNLLEDAKRLLTLPFSYVLAGMPLMVRDVARQLGKDVTLEMTGTEVQIDKRILEGIKDPLIHLLRNAVDHGIESPQVRVNRGKPSTARIQLDVRQVSGSEVEVTVRDDGGGIDKKAVVAAAKKKGVPGADDIGDDDDAALELIFASSVSTSQMVTEISGRGLGMAIVREKIDKMGGRLRLETQLGKGTTFHLTLPLTLATLRGVLVESAGHFLVVPLVGVARAVRIPMDDIRRVANRETVTVEGRGGQEVLPLVKLSDVLQLPAKGVPANDKRNWIVALLLRDGERQAAFAVDEVLGEQEVLIKPLAWPLLRLEHIAGSTLLSSGRVVPVLNTADLLAASLPSSAPTISSEGSGEDGLRVDKDPYRVLVAEDSITSRMLLKHILETAGYNVRTAVDGMDAADILQKETFDLVVSDVDMPRMTGFELTAHIRSLGNIESLPVVLVTARDSREDREHGVEVGANAYIVKSAFDQSDLLQVISRLI